MSLSTGKEQTLRQFCDVTGADEDRSKFFLESSNWQLDVALSSFYEHGGNTDDVPANPAAAASSLPTLSDSDMESPPGSPLQAKKKDKKKPANTKFATLDSLHQESSSDEEEATCSKYKNGGQCQVAEEFEKDLERLRKEVERLLSENKELQKEIEVLKGRLDEKAEGQAFYAGGSERSGQQIIGPGKGRKDIVTEVFKSVRERGAVVFEDEPSSTSRGRSAFSGVGYRLGQTADDPAPVAPAGNQQQQQQQTDQPRSVRLRLYREGFTVDSGPLRQYSDPDHADFLNSIRRGEIPSELAGGGGEVRVSLEDRRHEECPRHVPKQSAFTGKGHLLGSPTPATVGAPSTVTRDAADRDANVRAAQLAVSVDDGQPTTTIQFRLADGSRLTGRFNHTHTVGDLHQYVARAEPAYQLQAFTLLTTFPSTELSDLKATLAQAKILNTTLLQRLK